MASERSWPLPSESAEVRQVLYLGEGLVIGGVVGYLLVRFALGFRVNLVYGDLPLPVVELLFLGVLVLGAIRLIPLSSILGNRRDGSRPRENWRQTRRWGLVLVASLGTLVGFFGGLIGVLGLQLLVFNPLTAVVLVAPLLVGVCVLTFAWHQIEKAHRRQPRSRVSTSHD